MPQPSMYSSSTSSPCDREQSSSSSSSCSSSGSGSGSDSISGKRSCNQSTTNVTAFLSKLWRIVDDKAYDDMVCWSQSGCSFIIINQTRFAKELLPLYFKHGNMASFIRQLNMYGFRKLSNNCSNGMKKIDHRTISPEVAHFYHVNFMRDNERKIADIKRKSNSYKAAHHFMANGSFCDEVRAMISDVKSIRELQSSSESILGDMHIENETLWREVDLLRARHQKQQKVVERVLQFLTLVSSTDNKIKKEEEDCSQSSMSMKRRRQYQQQHHKQQQHQQQQHQQQQQQQQQHQQQQHQQIVLYLDQAEQQNMINNSNNINNFNMSPAYNIESPDIADNDNNDSNDYNNVRIDQQQEQEQTNLHAIATTTTPDLVVNNNAKRFQSFQHPYANSIGSKSQTMMTQHFINSSDSPPINQHHMQRHDANIDDSGQKATLVTTCQPIIAPVTSLSSSLLVDQPGRDHRLQETSATSASITTTTTTGSINQQQHTTRSLSSVAAATVATSHQTMFETASTSAPATVTTSAPIKNNNNASNWCISKSSFNNRHLITNQHQNHHYHQHQSQRQFQYHHQHHHHHPQQQQQQQQQQLNSNHHQHNNHHHHHQQQQQEQIQFQHHQQQHVSSLTDQITNTQLNNVTMGFQQHQQLFSLDQDDSGVYSSGYNTSTETNSSSTNDLLATYWPTP